MKSAKLHENRNEHFEFCADVRHIPIKRAFDLSFSLIALLTLLPFLFLISALIYVTTPGPIFFAHHRIGRGGKPFKCLKFRTMTIGAEQSLTKILKSDPKLNAEWQKNFKLKNDPRVTKVGRYLRKFSLDELPQLINVIKGELSIVGPRPVMLTEIQTFYGSKAEKILSVRPGMTGLWQISGRNNCSYAERVQLDEKYVSSQSLKNDFKIIYKTIPALITSKGSF